MKAILLIALAASACWGAYYFVVTPDSHLVVLDSSRDTLWKSSDVVQYDSAGVAGNSWTLNGLDSADIWQRISDSIAAHPGGGTTDTLKRGLGFVARGTWTHAGESLAVDTSLTFPHAGNATTADSSKGGATRATTAATLQGKDTTAFVMPTHRTTMASNYFALRGAQDTIAQIDTVANDTSLWWIQTAAGAGHGTHHRSSDTVNWDGTVRKFSGYTMFTGRDTGTTTIRDSVKSGKLYVANVSALADTGRTVMVINSPAVGTVTHYGTGLSDFTWYTSSYAGHNTVDTIWVACQYAGVGGDTMKWKLGRTGTYAKWIVTGAKKAFSVGCSTTVGATTGHTAGDSWAVPLSAPCPLVVKHSNGTMFAKVYPDGSIQNGYGNTASGLNSTVAGGTGNTASALEAFVGSGDGNVASAGNAVICGGSSNTASSGSSFIGGGANNTAGASYAVVGGGNTNIVKGYAAFIPGGVFNLDSAPYSGALGDSNRNRAADTCSILIGGGWGTGRNTSTGKWQVGIGWKGINTMFWAADSMVVNGAARVAGALTGTTASLSSWFVVGGGDTLGKLAPLDAGDSVELFITRHGAHQDTWKLRK